MCLNPGGPALAPMDYILQTVTADAVAFPLLFLLQTTLLSEPEDLPGAGFPLPPVLDNTDEEERNVAIVLGRKLMA